MIAAVLAGAALLGSAAPAAAPFPAPPGLQDTPANRDWLARNVEVGDWLPYGVTGNAFVFFKPGPSAADAEALRVWVRQEYIQSPTEDGKIGSTLMQFETDCTRKLIRNLTFVAYGRTNFRDLVQFVERADDWRQAGRFSSVGQALEWACASEAAYRAVPWPAISVHPTGEIVTDYSKGSDTAPDALRTVTQRPSGEIVTVLRSGAVRTETLKRPTP